MIGFLLFNPLSKNIIFVLLTSFFGATGSYSYNNIKDKKEDSINRKKSSIFISKTLGLVVVFASFSLGFLFSLSLTINSILIYSFGIAVSIAYSFFKLKKFFIIKNLYTGFATSLTFLIGASNISIGIIQYYLLISFFVFIVSIISDLRDYKGDNVNNFRTLPVTLGYETTRKVVFFLLCMFSLLVFNSHLIMLLPFSLAALFFVYKNKPIIAHSVGGFSFISLVFFLLLGSM